MYCNPVATTTNYYKHTNTHTHTHLAEVKKREELKLNTGRHN